MMSIYIFVSYFLSVSSSEMDSLRAFFPEVLYSLIIEYTDVYAVTNTNQPNTQLLSVLHDLDSLKEVMTIEAKKWLSLHTNYIGCVVCMSADGQSFHLKPCE